MKKKVVLLLCLVLSFVCLTGCGVQKSVDPVVEETPKDEKGFQKIMNELSVYLPEELQTSPYNGMLGVYEFYTGEFKDAGPTGLDYMVLVDEVPDDFKIEDYAKKNAKGAKKGYTLGKLKFNDHVWYGIVMEHEAYYCSEYNGYVYDISIVENDDLSKVYPDVIMMTEKTLYFEESDAN